MIKTAFNESCPIKKSQAYGMHGFWTKSLKNKHHRLIMARRKISTLRRYKDRKEMLEAHKNHQKGKKTFTKLVNKTFRNKRKNSLQKLIQ